MRVHKKAVQMTLLVCLLATTVCVRGAFLFIARQLVSAGPVSKAEISLHPECRAKSKTCGMPRNRQPHDFWMYSSS